MWLQHQTTTQENQKQALKRKPTLSMWFSQLVRQLKQPPSMESMHCTFKAHLLVQGIECIRGDGVTNSESGNRQTLRHVPTHSTLHCGERHHGSQLYPGRCCTLPQCWCYRCCNIPCSCKCLNIFSHNPSHRSSPHNPPQLHLLENMSRAQKSRESWKNQYV